MDATGAIYCLAIFAENMKEMHVTVARVLEAKFSRVSSVCHVLAIYFEYARAMIASTKQDEKYGVSLSVGYATFDMYL